MHTHVSGLTAAQVFLMVLILGTLWRLSAAHLAMRGGLAAEAGKAMAFQY
jgi:hypothetical protein